MVDLKADLGFVQLKNPVMLASGTCGYGPELADLLDLGSIGALVVKGISLEPRPGNPPPRVCETPCGLLNAIGLENIGVTAFIETRLPWLREQGLTVLVNILGNSIEDYRRMAEKLAVHQGIAALEVNISCPNVKEGGVAFGTSVQQAARVTAAVKDAAGPLPVVVKLSPNVTDITEIARAVEDAGADAVSLVNTLLGMAIDIERRRPVLGNIFGGLSGPAIKPVALRMVWQVARAVSIPVIGMGGITTWQDAVEFLMAGAKAVQIGTATLVKPSTAQEILEGITRFMEGKGYHDIQSLVID